MARQFPHAERPWVDLSTGINPWAYPVPPSLPDDLTALPDEDRLQALHQIASSAYGAPGGEYVAACAGTQALIGVLPWLWPQSEIAIVEPTYAEHAACWQAAGASVRSVAHVEQLFSASAGVICTPNNPDGRVVERDTLRALADHMAARGGVLVVDEAFADLHDAPGAASLLPHPALIVLRSFGKAYGLAGIRLGFALASCQRIARLRQVMGPWPVSGQALRVGAAALDDTPWRAQMRQATGQAAGRMDHVLRDAGMEIVGGTTLFRLARTPKAAEIFQRLGQKGIMVRSFSSQPTWLRFGLPRDEEQWRRLMAALLAP